MKKLTISLTLVLFGMLTVLTMTIAWSSPLSVTEPAGAAGVKAPADSIGAMAASGSYHWALEEVDVPKSFYYATDRALRVDASDHPHLVYGGDHLYYAYHDGVAWDVQTVDDGPCVGSSASLALDGSGRPHIAYIDDYNEQVKYATWTGSVWQIETVASTFPGAYYAGTSIALDGANVPGIAYFGEVIGDDWDHSLYFARPSGGGWQVSLVREGLGLWLVGPSADFDPAGQPQIAFSEGVMMPDGEISIKLAQWTGSAWSLQTISTTGYGSLPSLTLDGSGWPHIAFAISGTSHGVYYKYWNGSQWELELVDDTEFGVPSLALDSQGRPHIVARDTYFARDNGIWVSESVGYGYRPSIALSSDDEPCIGGPKWDDGLSKTVFSFSHREGDAWLEDIVYEPTGQGVGEGLSFALDSNQDPHFSYSARGLRYTTLVNESWHMEDLTPSATGAYDTLVLDSQDRPYFAYRTWTVEYGEAVGLAHWTGNEWQYEAVDSASEEDPIVLHLDSQDRPHLGYICPGNTDICYAFWNGSEWVKQVVDSHGFGSLSMALDSQDRPRFVYQDYGLTSPTTWEYYLRYTRWDGNAWQTETVSSGSWDQVISLALDAADVPHVVFWGITDQGSWLKYATRDGDAWQIETVNEGYGHWAAFRLDSYGQPHVAFQLAYLHYAHRKGDSWTVRQVGKVKASNIVLDLDQDDWPVIAYLGDNIPGLYLLRGMPFPEKVYLPVIRR